MVTAVLTVTLQEGGWLRLGTQQRIHACMQEQPAAILRVSSPKEE